jgi:hypothetical protein
MEFAALRSAVRSRRFAWLLALAFWLPVAQWTAATHALLHLHAAAGTQGAPDDERRQPAQLPGPCDLCVVAAAIGGAAPLPAATSVAVAQGAGDAPAYNPPPALLAAPALAYLSRAPPALHA